MITGEECVDIISLHRQGLSIRVIGARLGISRNTARAALRRVGPPIPQAADAKVMPFALSQLRDEPSIVVVPILNRPVSRPLLSHSTRRGTQPKMAASLKESRQPPCCGAHQVSI